MPGVLFRINDNRENKKSKTRTQNQLGGVGRCRRWRKHTDTGPWSRGDRQLCHPRGERFGLLETGRRGTKRTRSLQVSFWIDAEKKPQVQVPVRAKQELHCTGFLESSCVFFALLVFLLLVAGQLYAHREVFKREVGTVAEELGLVSFGKPRGG